VFLYDRDINGGTVVISNSYSRGEGSDTDVGEDFRMAGVNIPDGGIESGLGIFLGILQRAFPFVKLEVNVSGAWAECLARVRHEGGGRRERADLVIYHFPVSKLSHMQNACIIIYAF